MGEFPQCLKNANGQARGAPGRPGPRRELHGQNSAMSMGPITPSGAPLSRCGKKAGKRAYDTARSATVRHAPRLPQDLGCPDERVRLRPHGGRAARGGRVRATDDRAAADLLPAHTCSVREKAQREGVFAASASGGNSSGARPGVIIGRRGCVATRKARITGRAPFVDWLFGRRPCTWLPRDSRAAAPTMAVPRGREFPEIEKLTACPNHARPGDGVRLDHGGLQKYCTFCVVPYTRGEEVSPPGGAGDDEIRGLAAQGVCEVTAARPERQRLPRPARRRRHADLAALIYHGRGGAGHRTHPLHDVASGSSSAPASSRPTARCASWRATCTCRCRCGLRPHPRHEEARSHGARVQAEDPPPARARPVSAVSDFIIGFPGETERDLSRPP